MLRFTAGRIVAARRPRNYRLFIASLKIDCIMANETIYKELGLLGSMFKFMDRHQRLSDAVLVLEAIALAYVVFMYDFTTNF